MLHMVSSKLYNIQCAFIVCLYHSIGRPTSAEFLTADRISLFCDHEGPTQFAGFYLPWGSNKAL